MNASQNVQKRNAIHSKCPKRIKLFNLTGKEKGEKEKRRKMIST
jgi:hypothetical protein